MSIPSPADIAACALASVKYKLVPSAKSVVLWLDISETVPVTFPVTLPVKLPVTLPVTAPVTGPVCVPAVSPVTSPVTFPVKLPVTFPVTLPVTAPVTSPVRLPVIPLLAPNVVKLPAAATVPPIVVLSIVPPLMSAVSATKLSMLAVPSICKSRHSFPTAPRS